MRRFECRRGSSDKFWETEYLCTESRHIVFVRYGRRGTNGQTENKAFESAYAADRHMRKKIAEKLAKGYLEVGAPQRPITAHRPAQELGRELLEGSRLPLRQAVPPVVPPTTQKTDRQPRRVILR